MVHCDTTLRDLTSRGRPRFTPPNNVPGNYKWATVDESPRAREAAGGETSRSGDAGTRRFYCMYKVCSGELASVHLYRAIHLYLCHWSLPTWQERCNSTYLCPHGERNLILTVWQSVCRLWIVAIHMNWEHAGGTGVPHARGATGHDHAGGDAGGVRPRRP